MDAKIEKDRINGELERVYRDYKQYMAVADDKHPVLMQCKANYLKEDNIRVLFVGEDADNWYNVPDVDMGSDIVKYGMSLYNKYNMKANMETSFFSNLIDHINRRLNGSRINNYLWTVFFPFGDYKWKQKKASEIYEFMGYSLDLLKKQIDICKPDAVVFVTNKGVAEDVSYIKQVVGSDTLLLPMKDYKKMSVIRGSKSFKIPMLRFPISSNVVSNNWDGYINKLTEYIKENVAVEEYSY